MKYIIPFIAILFFTLKTNAQSNYQIAGQSLPELQTQPVLEIKTATFQNYQNVVTPETVPSLFAVFKDYPTAENTGMPKAWAYKDLAFFCKIEVDIEKATKLPVKFRIGEVQQVEKMEGKLKSY